MREAFLRIAAPTLLFAGSIFVFEWIRYQPGFFPIGTWTLFTVIVVPLTWLMVAGVRGSIDRRRWVASGALAGAIIVLLPSLYHLILGVFGVARGQGAGWGEAILIVSAFSTTIVAGVLASFGAAMGALAAVLLGRRGVKTEPAESQNSPGRNA